jgi:starch phosphorylase
MIRQWIQFIRCPEVRGHAVFLSDYDMLLTEQLVVGVDVWINNPRRPWEACGTSGMKVLANGGLNLSELDGWWAEAYNPRAGLGLGDGREHGDDPAWDASEADALYAILEKEVIPQFYARDGNGIPTQWPAKMRESMATLTAQFSANREVREYTDKYYLPAAAAYHRHAADKGALGAQIADWQRALAAGWQTIKSGEARVETREGRHHFEVPVDFGDVSPDAVRVELYADTDDTSFTQAMTQRVKITDGGNKFLYSAQVPATRPVIVFPAASHPSISGRRRAA